MKEDNKTTKENVETAEHKVKLNLRINSKRFTYNIPNYFIISILKTQNISVDGKFDYELKLTQYEAGIIIGYVNNLIQMNNSLLIKNTLRNKSHFIDSLVFHDLMLTKKARKENLKRYLKE